MKTEPRPTSEAPLGESWFKGENVFAQGLQEPTQCLDVTDLLPAREEDVQRAVTYARGGNAVSLQGASLVLEQIEEFSVDMPVRVFPRFATHQGLVRLLWQIDAEVRRVPGILRGIRADLTYLVRERQIPVAALSGAFGAGVVTTLMLGWIF